jgi:hypothetical protein
VEMDGGFGGVSHPTGSGQRPFSKYSALRRRAT